MSTGDRAAPVSPQRLVAAVSTLQQHRAAWLEADPYLLDDETELTRLITEEAPDAEETINRLVRGAIQMESRAAQAEAALEQLRARMDRYKRRGEALRYVIVEVMQALGKRRLDAADFTVNLRIGGVKVHVTDLDKLPAAYVREKTERTADKIGLKAALEAGEVIEGATLGNSREGISIRTI